MKMIHQDDFEDIPGKENIVGKYQNCKVNYHPSQSLASESRREDLIDFTIVLETCKNSEEFLKSIGYIGEIPSAYKMRNEKYYPETRDVTWRKLVENGFEGFNKERGGNSMHGSNNDSF